MNYRVLRLRREDGEALAKVWHVPGLEVGECGGAIWLRVPVPSHKPDAAPKEPDEAPREPEAAHQEPEAVLAALPAEVRFLLEEGGRLRREGKRVPEGFLPSFAWVGIKEYIKIGVPEARRSGSAALHSGAVELKLVRDAHPREPELLETDLDRFARFVSEASEIRLRPLRFAVSEARDVLVLGTPLPSTRGRRYWTESRIAVPLGYTWQPEVSAASVRAANRLRASDWLIMREKGEPWLIADELFLDVNRASVRISLQGTGAVSP